MPDSLVKMSDGDLAVLRAMVADFRAKKGRGINRPSSSPPDDDLLWTPEVYVAYTPSAIAALDTNATGTPADDVATGVDCRMFRLNESDGTFTDINLTRKLYNLASSDIPGGAWVLAVRDKFGRWIAVPTSASGDGSSSCSDCHKFAFLESTDCLLLTVISVAGRCDNVNADQTVTLQSSDSGVTWVSVSTPPFATDTHSDWTVTWDWPGETTSCCPRLKFTRSATTVWAKYLGCCNGKMQFAVGTSAFCGDDAATPCADNTVVVELDCTACPLPCDEVPNPNYTTPGWYYVNGVCEYLSSDPMNCVSIVGPYATEHECTGSNPQDHDCCLGAGESIPSTVYITFGGTLAGAHGALAESPALTWASGDPLNSGTNGISSTQLTCQPSPWGWLFNVSGVNAMAENWGTSIITVLTVYCHTSGHPFVAIISGHILNADNPGNFPEGDFTAVISETP